MNKLFYVLALVVVLSSCSKEADVQLNQTSELKGYLSEHYDLSTLNMLKIDESVYRNMDLMIEGLDKSKVENVEQSASNYFAFLEDHGVEINQNSQLRSDDFSFQDFYDSDQYSNEFKSSLLLYENLITTMGEYEDFTSSIINSSSIQNSILVLSIEEKELMSNIIFITDLLFQFKLQEAIDLENGRLKIDWHCVGSIAIGAAWGGMTGGAFGAVFLGGAAAYAC